MLKLVLCVFAMIFIQLMPLIPFDFAHVKNLFWIILPFYKHIALFGWLSLIQARNWAPFLFLDSLFFEKYYAKILEFFSTGWTGWEPVQPVLHDQPHFINPLPCFGWFSLIQARNWALFLFLDSLVFEKYYVKISEFLSTGWTGWEPVQPVLHDQPYFINTLPCFCRFSLIRAWNWALFLLLDSLFFSKYVVKISEFFSTIWIDWEPVQ